MKNSWTPFRLLIVTILGATLLLSAYGLLWQKSPATLGVLVPLTGDRAAYGVAIRDGIVLAVDEMNAQQGWAGAPIRLVVEDTKGTSRDCVSAFEKLTSQDKIGVVLGPMSSSEVLSVAPLAEQRQVLLFTPSASSPAISDAGDYVFRNVPSDVFEGGAMAEIAAAKLKLKTMGLLYINTDYGIGVVQAFRAEYEKLGGVIVAAEAYSDGTRDFRTLLQKIKEAAPEALYIVGYKEMGTAVAQKGQLALPQRLLSTAIFEDPEILEAAGPAAEGLVFTSITFDPSNPDPRAVAFTNNFRNRFNREPDGYAASAYDAAHILGEAVRLSGSVAPSELKRALYGMKNFRGLLGDVNFDANGDAHLPIKLKRIVNGRFEQFAP
ncbi:MAG TPA: penicillin-binding protein activator [Phycisphaerae bacterium]|nr:penicillin-binding protein activator [Phycisphaerae bacterium]